MQLPFYETIMSPFFSHALDEILNWTHGLFLLFFPMTGKHVLSLGKLGWKKS